MLSHLWGLGNLRGISGLLCQLKQYAEVGNLVNGLSRAIGGPELDLSGRQCGIVIQSVAKAGKRLQHFNASFGGKPDFQDNFAFNTQLPRHGSILRFGFAEDFERLKAVIPRGR